MQRSIERLDEARVRDGLARVREAVRDAAARSGRDPGEVSLLAAVKYVDAASCAVLVDAGVVDLAENRLAQLVDKQDAPGAPRAARWHFIGRLQSREAVQVASRVAVIHTLASASAARRLAAAWSDGAGGEPPAGERAQVLVQVNADGDPAKDGLLPADVERFLEELPDPVAVHGLMTMPAFADDPERSRGAFAELRELRDRLAPAFAGRHELRALSMGTSQDFGVAVEEGATHVRLGRILFGQGE